MRLIKILVVAAFALVASAATASASASTVAPQSSPPGARLTYLGGPVISHTSIESVYWGSGPYETGVGPGELPIVEFFQGVTDSPHLDWLTEYDTTNQLRLPGVPPQSIGRGTYQGQTTISPSTTGSTISESDVANELVHQIDAGAVPPPQLDASGQVQTLYAMFFPKPITLTALGSVGGETGGFCAYHSTAVRNGLAIPYMVLPDFESHHFADGCGAEPVLFNNFTAVTAHEIVESITDPAVGVGVASWIDPALGEVADICGQQHGTVLGGNGLTHVVQLEFSNVLSDCIVSRSAVPPPARNGYVNACGLASRTGFADAGLAADCLEQYGIALGKSDGTFGENDGLVRSQVSSLLARLIELSGITLTQTQTFADVAGLADGQVRGEIQQLAGVGIIEGFPDGQFHPNDNLTVAQAATLVMRTLEFVHAPNIADQGSTGANYLVAVNNGLLDRDASNIRGFSYRSGAADITDRGLLADMVAQSVQRLVDTSIISRV